MKKINVAELRSVSAGDKTYTFEPKFDFIVFNKSTSDVESVTIRLDLFKGYLTIGKGFGFIEFNVNKDGTSHARDFTIWKFNDVVSCLFGWLK